MVYIYLQRTNRNLSLERRRYLELVAGGREVVYVRPGENLQGSRKQWLILDRDVLTPERYERAERIWNEFWKGKRKGVTHDD